MSNNLCVGTYGSGTGCYELAGLTRGDEYDLLIVTGTADLTGGALRVTLGSGFSPLAGDSFDILDWGVLVGQFEAITLPELEQGLCWDISELHTTGALTVVPEPGVLVLLACGALMLRRRRG